MTHSEIFLSLVAAILAALMSAFLTQATRPMLLRVALAKPNARSSHRIPTPQGAGIAVIAATLIVATAVIAFEQALADVKIPLAIFGATLFIAIVGFADDVNSIPALPRLLLQGLAVAVVVVTAPDELQMVPACPFWIERGLLLVAGLLVREPRQLHGRAGPDDGRRGRADDSRRSPARLVERAAGVDDDRCRGSCGALLGFTPFNRPVERYFSAMSVSSADWPAARLVPAAVAYDGQFAAALLLPLYYLTDATVTLFRRMIRHEPFWAAHRSHFYQRATDNGFTVWRVVGEVFTLNVGLAVLAIISMP